MRAKSFTVIKLSMVYLRLPKIMLTCYMALIFRWKTNLPILCKFILYLWKMVSVLVQTRWSRITLFWIGVYSKRRSGNYPRTSNQIQYIISSFIWKILSKSWLKFAVNKWFHNMVIFTQLTWIVSTSVYHAK